jgi:Uma2 family endonuclease
MTIQEKLYTIEEFLEIAQLPENENKRLELIEGVIHVMPSSSRKNTVVAFRMGRFLGNHADERDLGYITGADGGFELGPKTVLIPDVGYIFKERAGGLVGVAFPVAPDLAVEVILPSETARGLLDKVRVCLLAGTQMVWAVHPASKVIDVYRLAENNTLNIQIFDIDSILDGGSVLPGFSLAVKEIFKGLEDADH